MAKREAPTRMDSISSTELPLSVSRKARVASIAGCVAAQQGYAFKPIPVSVKISSGCPQALA